MTISNSINRLLFGALLVVVCVGCGPTEPAERTLSIRALKALYQGYPVRVAEQVVVSGVVVGTDRYGELYHQLLLQDHTGGVIFSIDNPRLYESYSVGDSLRVRCCGLTLGAYGHSIRVGCAPEGDGYETSPIGWAQWCSIVEDCGVGAEPQAERLEEISSLGPQHLSTLVRLDGVRFVEGGQTLTVDGAPTSRHLVGANDTEPPTDTLIVRASSRSDFADILLPEGECSVVGIAGYFYNAYQLTISSPDHIVVAPR